MRATSTLRLVKLIHTMAWLFFAGCILALSLAAYSGRLDFAFVLIAFVAVEAVVLALNGCACPLTAVAARYTEERRDNFDIFLPLWLARYNKQIFGVLFLAGVFYTAFVWWRSYAGT